MKVNELQKMIMEKLKNNSFFNEINVKNGHDYFNFIESQNLRTEVILDLIQDSLHCENNESKVSLLNEILLMINIISNAVNNEVWKNKEHILND